MNVVILGHLVLDEIHAFDGSIIESAGGITYPLSAFGAAAGEGDTLLPVFPYGEDAADLLTELQRRFPSIDAGNCTLVQAPNTRVRLFHDAQAGYNTQLVSSLGSIPRRDLERVLPSAHLVYLNMMTGHDILPKDARLLRSAERLVYLDLHMIAYKVHTDGYREPAAPENWMAWAQATDVLHCNEREFAAFLGGDDNEYLRRKRLFDASDLRCLVVTRAERGADIYSAPDSVMHVPAWPADRIVDTTGCGDTFGSIFALGLARGEDAAFSAKRASRAAAFVATIPGSHGIEALRTVLMEDMA